MDRFIKGHDKFHISSKTKLLSTYTLEGRRSFRPNGAEIYQIP